ncbi:MAG TPA: long-chain-fatty-acid--CoA ligase [Streptosporangiaceae bacterium]|nr:long-chain-fatty-acid--CoA ligase [Streptosporangiaceae bacterium]
MNVYPQEAENVLAGHPAVAGVAVIGVPDEEMGEVVKAVVQCADPGAAGPELAAELLAFCRAELSAYKCPRTVGFTGELAPRPERRALQAPPPRTVLGRPRLLGRLGPSGSSG